jgi:hypothetical protein
MLAIFIFLLLAITTNAGHHKKHKQHFTSIDTAETSLRKKRKKSIMNAAQALSIAANEEYDTSIHNCIWHSKDLCATINNTAQALVADHEHITYENVWLEDVILDHELDYCVECEVEEEDQCICEFIHGESMQSVSGSCMYPKMQIGNVCYNLFDEEWNDNHMCEWDDWYMYEHHRQVINGTLHWLPLRPCNFECISNCALAHMGSLGVSCATVINDLTTCGNCTSQQNALWLGFTHCSCDHHDEQTPCESDYACQWNATGQVCQLDIYHDSEISGSMDDGTYVNTQCIDNETALVTHYAQPNMTCVMMKAISKCDSIGNVCAVTCDQCGCTNSSSPNYRSDADIDNGTCEQCVDDDAALQVALTALYEQPSTANCSAAATTVSCSVSSFKAICCATCSTL